MCGLHFSSLPDTCRDCCSRLPARQNNSWLDAATRAVFVEFTTYNPNVNQICYVWLRMEMPPGGGVVPAEDICCAHFNQYATVKDYWRLGNEILFTLCALCMSASEACCIARNLGERLSPQPADGRPFFHFISYTL